MKALFRLPALARVIYGILPRQYLLRIADRFGVLKGVRAFGLVLEVHCLLAGDFPMFYYGEKLRVSVGCQA